jgi:hypothetical protein
VTGVRFYVVLDGDTPLSLLRRTPAPDGGVVAEALRRDLRWYPTDRFRTTARNGEYEIAEITAARAAELVAGWRTA